MLPQPAVDSDHLDDDDEVEEQPKKKRKLTKAAEAKLKAKAKKAKKDEDEYDDSEDDTYTALSKAAQANARAKPPVGSFDTCAKCSKQFTVTKYTVAANPPPGYLCHPCAKSGGGDPFKKPAAPRKRKSASEKRTVTSFEERQLPSLVSLCIQTIAKHINDVEALGDIGTVNTDNIIRALSRNRSLTHENVSLFYNVENKNLTLYDATKLQCDSLRTLALLNPNITSLRLDFCGRMDDSVLNAWSTALPALTRLELLGPFLVRVPAWVAFFKSHPQLEAFLIVQSPRFDLECMNALANTCKGLKELRLKEIGLLDDSFLAPIKKLKQLTHLDLADSTESITEDAAIALMKAIGARLEHLDLSGHTNLSDDFLLKGLRPHAKHLKSLILNNLDLSDKGTAMFFDKWHQDPFPPALKVLSLSRVLDLAGDALLALLECVGGTLQELNINGWRATSEDALRAIGTSAPALKKLDVGWNRALDDFVMKAIVDGCGELEELKCWGCNRVTDNYPRKRGLSVLGVESHVVI
ncbi:RNI-like protein [Artomyces pyxidatus]|uniref:RNI-like protein n=1 Tax=Artomyces pyxidatus TaxID=48021 RepID=A0ACB8TC25_9AGAM|nr:RNI-like protein [Artomyces pyxidatus]